MIIDWLAGSKRKHKQVEAVTLKIINSLQLLESNRRLREERRCPAAIGLRIVPVRHNGQIDSAAAFDAASRDLTTEGLSFTHRRYCRSGERMVITVEFAGGVYHFMCEARHCTAIGRGLFLTGCAILEPTAAPPCWES